MNPGTVPQEWRIKRRLLTLEVDPDAKFIDVGDANTHAWLTETLADTLRLLGVDAPIDVSLINGPNRLVTRAVAVHAYTSETEGAFLYDGIAYRSHLNADWLCWAIFQDTVVDPIETARVAADDEDLVAVSKMWNLRIF